MLFIYNNTLSSIISLSLSLSLSLSPTKHDFIVAKYKHLALLPRVTLKDSASMTEDLSKVSFIV